jgi:hypothetical protein
MDTTNAKAAVVDPNITRSSLEVEPHLANVLNKRRWVIESRKVAPEIVDCRRYQFTIMSRGQTIPL